MVKINERSPDELGSNDPRYDKLPLWAKQEIRRLEYSVDYWKHEATIGPDGSDTFAQRVELEQPLGRGTDIAFAFTEGRVIVNKVEGRDEVEVSGLSDLGGPLSVMPWSSSVVRIRLAGRE